jgi:hypothetical protein
MHIYILNNFNNILRGLGSLINKGLWGFLVSKISDLVSKISDLVSKISDLVSKVY